MTEVLKHDLTYTGHNQQALHALLVNMKDLCNELKTDFTALKADVTGIRTKVSTAVNDITSCKANHNTLIAKLNADGGVTDTNYATATPKTLTAPATLTVTTISASSLSLLQG